MPINTRDVSGCQAECNSKGSECGGFVFNNARECYLKNSDLSTAATSALSGSDLYIKTINTPSLRTESFTNNISKLNYSMY